MPIVRFTKFWPELGIEAMAERATSLGYDGFDLAVREGHAVSPSNVAEVLPRAVRHWQAQGLVCPLVTAGVDTVDASTATSRRLFRAAGNAGVSNIKIGYFQYVPGESFQTVWDKAKRQLQGFERLSRDTGVRSLCHTHSGLCLGSNCSGLRHLLEDCDPQWVGAYPDLGHLAVNGEDARIGLAMLEGRIGALAAKDAHHVKDPRPDARARYADCFVPLGEGAAEVEAALRVLESMDFNGPISVHTEYTVDQSVIETVGGIDHTDNAQMQRENGEVQDLAYLRDVQTRIRNKDLNA